MGKTQSWDKIKRTRGYSSISHHLALICDALRDLVPFAQFKKREKHPWRSVTFSTPSWVFSRFLNCSNGTKLRKASHICLKGSCVCDRLIQNQNKSKKINSMVKLSELTVLFTASGLRYVLLCPNSMTMHANKSYHALTQEIRTIKTMT